MDVTQNAEPVDLPEGWEGREARRRRRVLDAMAAAAPTAGEGLSEMSDALGLSESRITSLLGLEPAAVPLIEGGRATSMLLDLDVEKLRQLCERSKVSPERLALAVAVSFRSASGPECSCRPRAETVPVRALAAPDHDRLVSWIADFLRPARAIAAHRAGWLTCRPAGR